MIPTPPFLNRTALHPQIGLCVMHPSPGVIERIGPDWDWIWIDAQHGDLDFREVVTLIRACHLIGRPGFVRVPSHDAGWVGKALDAGAAGVIVPMVETLEEARAMVRAAKFPPTGNRSYGGRRVIDLQGRSYYQSANQATALILQVESRSACDLAGELAALGGVDGLFLGPDDLLIREGMDVDAPKDDTNLGFHLRTVTKACQQTGKLSVVVAVSETAMELARACGCRLIVGWGDVGFLAQGSQTASRKMRAFFAEGNVSGDSAATLY